MRTIRYYFLILSTLVLKYIQVRKMEKKLKRGELSLADSYSKWDEVGHEFCGKLFDIAGIDLHVFGAEHVKQGPYLFVGNHQSNLDVPLLFYCSPVKMSFIAKKELDSIPFFGRIARSRGVIFMDRSSARKSITSINEGISLLKSGNSLAIFPEGTRSKNGELGEFKSGGLRLAFKSKVPIIPFAISGSHGIMEGKKGIITPGKVSLTFLEEINPDEFNDAKDLSIHIKNMIEKELKVEK